MRKLTIFIIASVIVMIMLIGNVVADKLDNPPIVDAEKPTLLDKLFSFFRFTEFTIVGQDRQCDETPISNIQNEFLGYWTVIPGTVGGGDSNFDASTHCSSGHGFWDVYVQETFGGGWVPKFEMEDWVYFNCLDDGKYQCIVELYCCPDGGCDADNDCDSDEECKTESRTDSYMPLLDPSTGNQINSYNFCTEKEACTGSDINCWRISNNVCEKRTYDCDYSTYPNCPSSYPYTSSSSCQEDIYVPGECTSGQTKCEGEIYYTCSNENWVSQM